LPWVAPFGSSEEFFGFRPRPRPVARRPDPAWSFGFHPQPELDQAAENAVSGSSGGGVRLCW